MISSIRYARDFCLPRGFPILWIPNIVLNLYGFYPKFRNDYINYQANLDTESATEVIFNYKYSGSLGQIISFKVNENYYYTICSKNSCGTFSDNLYRIIKNKIN